MKARKSAMKSGNISSLASATSLLLATFLTEPWFAMAQSSGFGIADLNTNVAFSFPEGNLVSNHSFEIEYGGIYQSWDKGGLPAIPMTGVKPRSGHYAAAVRYSIGAIPAGESAERSYF